MPRSWWVFIHGMFHVPLMVFTTTCNNVGNRWIVAPTDVATLTAAGVFYAWPRPAFAHTASESGLATLAAAVAVAAVLLVRGRTWPARSPRA